MVRYGEGGGGGGGGCIGWRKHWFSGKPQKIFRKTNGWVFATCYTKCIRFPENQWILCTTTMVQYLDIYTCVCVCVCDAQFF